MLNLFLFYCFFAIVIYVPMPVELTIIVYSILGSIKCYNVFQNKAPAHTKRNRIISVAFFLALSSIIYFLVKISGMEISNISRLSAVTFIPITILLAFTLPILGAELAYGISKFKSQIRRALTYALIINQISLCRHRCPSCRKKYNRRISWKLENIQKICIGKFIMTTISMWSKVSSPSYCQCWLPHWNISYSE